MTKAKAKQADQAADQAQDQAAVDEDTRNEAREVPTVNREGDVGTEGPGQVADSDDGPSGDAESSDETKAEDTKTGLTVHLTGTSGFSQDVIAEVKRVMQEAEVEGRKIKAFEEKAIKAANLDEFWAHVQAWVKVT